MKLNKYLPAILASAFCVNAYATHPIEPIMETIPAGSFAMGSNDNRWEQPIHTVNIPEFSMGKYEVTVKEFRQFVEATNYPVPQECRHELNDWFLMWTPGNWETNQLTNNEYQPVVCINWKTANAYVEWLAKETGKPYRLPSESEWEYAAKAGSSDDYYFGNDDDKTKICDYANTADLYGENYLQRNHNTSYYNWTSGMNNCSDNAAFASIVGMYKPNDFGLHDVISNVLEFTADCYVSGYEGAPTDGSPRLDGECKRRASRGGSWHWNHWKMTERWSSGEEFSGGVDGFRIALDGAAPALSKASKQFQTDLKLAQAAEKRRWEKRREFPKPVQNLTIEEQSQGIKLSWDKSQDEGVKSYRIYRNLKTNGRFRLLANYIKTPYFIDANTEDNEYEYTVVAVKEHLQSLYAEPVLKAGKALSIPAQLEAEWASQFSGTQLSYSTDTTDLERVSDVFTGEEGISADAIISYEILVEETGKYWLDYRVAAPDSTEGFELYLGSKKLATFTVEKTGGFNEWETQSNGGFDLNKGKHTLTIKSLDKGWKLNWISLKRS